MSIVHVRDRTPDRGKLWCKGSKDAKSAWHCGGTTRSRVVKGKGGEYLGMGLESSGPRGWIVEPLKLWLLLWVKGVTFSPLVEI